jgi:hypothetical protein
MRDALSWYLAIQVAAVAVWPIVSRALAPLADRGWAAAKAAGPLAIAWLVWLACMLTPLPFTRATPLVAVVAVGVATWAWAWRTNSLETTILWLRDQRRLLLVW